jgi:hypothetical protein
MTALLDAAPDQARRLNTGAVLPIDTGNPQQPFFVDDNDASTGSGAPHADGDAFYYFIAARDLLGRHGPLSEGTLITVCARFPASAPRSLRVSSDRHFDEGSGTVDTRLVLRWRPAASASDQPPVGFYVYRWDSVSEMHTTSDPTAVLAARASGLIPYVAAQSDYTWRDDGVGAPTLPADAGRTFWYSVRAVTSTACGDLESGDSAPAWGVLRDFRGPDNAPTVINLTDSRPTFFFEDLPDTSINPTLEAGFSGPTGDVRYLSLIVVRNDPAITTFRVGIGAPTGGTIRYWVFGQTDFEGGNGPVYFNQRIPVSYYDPANNVRLWMEARDITGRVERAHAPLNAFMADNSQINLVAVGVALETRNGTLAPGDTLPDGFTHRPVDPGTGEIVPLGLAVEVPDDAREYKAYKRINGGPLIFFAQGTEVDAPGSVVEIEDTTFPPLGGEVCYFIQWFDTHGNPSPLAALGCVPLEPKSSMPVPLLEVPQASGNAGAETVTLRWFCPPEGIERFRIYVGEGQSPARTVSGIDSATTVVRSPTTTIWRPVGSISLPSGGTSAPVPATVIEEEQFFPVDTPPLSSGFGDPLSPGLYSLDLEVAPGLNHRFYVVAIGTAGNESAASNIEDFIWQEPPGTPLPEVPWPARAADGLDPNFLTSVQPRIIDELPRFQGIGIHIGDYYGSSGNINFGGAYITDNQLRTTPTDFPDTASDGIQLFTTIAGESILPCVIYRQQVDPDTGEPVTGDLVQVSPMIEDLLLRSDSGRMHIYNPFVDIYSNGVSVGVYIKDTQPVILGNTYAYHAVRFKENGEIDRIVPLPIITLPLNP